MVLYFREMSAYQHQFARHYADGLDGCGLGQEARVRRGYYTLIRRFVEAFRQNGGLPRHRCGGRKEDFIIFYVKLLQQTYLSVQNASAPFPDRLLPITMPFSTNKGALHRNNH